MSDRRRHTRFEVDKGTYCYLDGCRVDARTSDLSAGGAFLRSDDELPMGALIVILFEDAAFADHPVHLVGRVVRQQGWPVAGIGVEWIHAISGASEAGLAAFLRRALRLEAPPGSIVEEGGEFQYDFHSAPVANRSPAVPTELPKNVVRLTDRIRAREGAGAPRMFVVRSDEGPPKAPSPAHLGRGGIPAWRRGSGPGPITRVIRQEEKRFPVRVAVDMTVGRTTCQGTISLLGRHGLTVETDVLPATAGTPILVNLPIPTAEDGLIMLLLSAELLSARPPTPSAGPGLLLGITRVHEENYPGLFERYLKWLQCRRVQGTG